MSLDRSKEPTDPQAAVRHARFARAAHRAKSHEDAHAQPPPLPKIDHAKHPNVPKGEAELIIDDDRLAELISDLRAAGSFAYDSEFIGELTYVPKLCLIQVASTKRIALVDPLAGLALKPFWELLADPSVEKIVHAGEQDIEPVFRFLARPATNVFDTQLGAGFIGMAYPVALNKLVSEVLGIKLGKGLTFTHWDQRPLSASQLRYAADDVRYLPAMREIMRQQLARVGHEKWAAEEFASMSDSRLYHFDPETAYLRVRGIAGLGGQHLAVLKELTIWRDETARQHDIPPRAFVRDEVLVELARNPVKDVTKLNRVRGLPRPVEHGHGAQIVAATQHGLSTPPAKVPVVRPEPTPSERFRADALWAAAQCLCIGQQLDPGLVTSRQEIGDLHRYLSRGGKEPKIGLLKGWRNEAVGKPLVEMVKAGRAIQLTWQDGSLRSG